MAVSDVLTLIGIIVVMAGHAFGLVKYLGNQREKDRKEIDDTITILSTRVQANKEKAQSEDNRIERAMERYHRDFDVKLAQIPTREHMEQMFVNRVGPLEHDLRALVVELARSGRLPRADGK